MMPVLAPRAAAAVLSGAAVTFLAFSAFGAPEAGPVPLLAQDEEPGYLGVTFGGEGLCIDEVLADTPAAAAGLQPGDCIVRIAGQDVETFGQLVEVLRHHPPGTAVALVTRRGEAVRESEITLGSRSARARERVEEGRADDAHPAVRERKRALRRVLEELEEEGETSDGKRRRIERELRRVLEDAPGVDAATPAGPGFLGVYLDAERDGAVVGGIVPGSAAEKAELRPGDRILAVDGQRIASGGALREALSARAAGTRVELRIARGDRKIEIELPLGARVDSRARELRAEPEEPLESAPPRRPRPPARDEGPPADLERMLRELQRRGAEQSRRWAGSYEEHMRELERQLREQGRSLERIFQDARGRGDRALLDPEIRERIRGELGAWARERARVLEENAERVRRLEEERVRRLGRMLEELRARRGPEIRERLRQNRRRFAEVERDVDDLLREEVAPRGREALREMTESLGALRGEVEGLRKELDSLRRALRALRAGG